MSVVTAITLQIDVGETYIEQENGPGIFPVINKINGWLAARNFGALAPLSDHYGGSKHPQVEVFGAGFDYFPWEDFAQFVMSLEWENPDNVVLLVNPEEGPTMVSRPAALSRT